ncbi:MAG: hypothetical protein R3C44_24760 [Chloroflexota bacterium]
MSQRPTGVTIISILAILAGAIGICWAITLSGFATVGWFTGALFGSAGLQDWGNSAVIGAISGAVGAVLSIIFGVGAWQLRPWAWWWGIIAMAVSLISPIISLFNGDIIPGMFGLIIPGAVLLYLLIPGTRQAFLGFDA